MIETPLRVRHDISSGWDFVRKRVSHRWLAGRGPATETVDLPHSWNRGDTFQYDRRCYSGRGAYRRMVDLPSSPEGSGSWRFRSEGFYGVGDVWLDGRAIARFDGQYLGFDIGLPSPLGTGRHQLAFRLDNLWQRNVLPGRRDPDFLLYGGLAGRVWIEWVPEVHIDPERVEVWCSPTPDGAESLELRCGINGLESLPDNSQLSWIVTAPDGRQTPAAGPVPIGEDISVISAVIPTPRCWSPDDPQLYWAEVRLETDNGVADTVRVRFGITRA